MQCEVQFDDIYEFPPELLDFALFSCVCPVFVPSAEQLNIYKAFIGHRSDSAAKAFRETSIWLLPRDACSFESTSLISNVSFPETVSRSFVVLGYIRGRLLVENDDLYEDLQDIVSGRLAKNKLSDFAKGSVRSEISEEDTVSWTASGQMDDSSSSELTCCCSFTEKVENLFKSSVAQKTRVVSRTFCRRNSIASKEIKYGQQYGDILCSYMDTEARTEYDMVKAQTLFTQTAFKQYKPDMIPTIISVRFDKRDRSSGRFWVVNKNIFSIVEKVLKKSTRRIIGFPLLHQRLDDVPIRQIPCVVRTRAESAYKAFYRAVPSRYDARTKRFSIFLVDLGWFKWVLANDVIDISAMNKSNPIRNLPVAMIHCQEDVTTVLHAKDLSRGTNCYIRVKRCPIQDVCLVDLLKAGRTIDDMTGSMGEMEGTSSSGKPPSETHERQLMASMMLETLNTENHYLATQTQHTRSLCCLPPFSMIMPVVLPMMMSMPVPNTALPSTGYEQTPKLQNSQTRNIGNTRIPQNSAKYSVCSRNYIHQRFRGNNLQNIQREWYDSDLSERNRVGFISGDGRTRNSFDRGSGGLSLKHASNYFYCASYALGRHVGELVICSGPSMHPTIQDGDLVIAERLSVHLRNLRRGDIVGALAPHDSSEMLCKRLTAMEHDTVTNCYLLPNGKIPRGHVYLEGDNTVASTDSRVFGPIPAGLVQVRLILRIWPFSRAGWISTHWFWEKPNE
ncbi:unnamed protein product [Acanthocheilonema viteae]|uniref:Peptidase S26 domain-containing protein n=1 Tax=Acanthocheilonema viteae TaxID=6277 RepID=A0A498S4W1_ACAVI|nr:unnamed protein product [Acanthocheilonema viteae]